jgi:hypothetical protein
MDTLVKRGFNRVRFGPQSALRLTHARLCGQDVPDKLLAEGFPSCHGNSYSPLGANVPLGDLLTRSDRLHIVGVGLRIIYGCGD